MRLAPHVSSQGPRRPGSSALRFSQPGLGRTQSGSALSLLARGTLREHQVPFRKKGPAGLTERLDVRIGAVEKEQLGAIARAAGLGVAELVRMRALGRPVVSRTDATTIRELRRLGGLLKKIHTDSAGAYSQQTAAVLGALRAAIEKLATSEPGAPT
jgi:hypothetical protein